MLPGIEHDLRSSGNRATAQPGCGLRSRRIWKGPLFASGQDERTSPSRRIRPSLRPPPIRWEREKLLQRGKEIARADRSSRHGGTALRFRGAMRALVGGVSLWPVHPIGARPANETGNQGKAPKSLPSTRYIVTIGGFRSVLVLI